MKITDVEVMILALPEIMERTDGSQDTAVVRVFTDDGIAGIGEVDSSPWIVKAIIEAGQLRTFSGERSRGAQGRKPPANGLSCVRGGTIRRVKLRRHRQ